MLDVKKTGFIEQYLEKTGQTWTDGAEEGTASKGNRMKCKHTSHTLRNKHGAKENTGIRG